MADIPPPAHPAAAPVPPVIAAAVVAPPVYLPLRGNAIAPDNITEADSMFQIFHWIGYTSAAERTSLVDDGLDSYESIKTLTEKDIRGMATDFARRTVAEGRLYFGVRRSKWMTAITYWLQDFDRVSREPTIVGFNGGTFKTALTVALAREEIRANMIQQSKTSADAASPGPLESEKKWRQWEEKFVNYARSHIGVNGIPLSYVIRSNDAPDHNKTFTDFVSETIACAPLTGEYFNADRMTVFNMIVSFTTGQPSGDWIKSTVKHANGRLSMKTLRDHFQGEGNASRNMAEAERLHESLFYKGERSLTFESFLTQCEKMYNIYDQEGEPYSDDAKVRFLFKKTQHQGLQGAINALKALQTAGTTVVTYTMAANHLSTAVSELPEYQANKRNIASIDTSGGKINSDILNADGTIKTGYIPKWRTLSQADKDKVAAARKSKRGGAKTGKDGSKTNNAAYANRLKQLTEANNKFKRQVKALKRAQNCDDSNDADDNTDASIDAGDQFGGKAVKFKKQKK